MNFGIPFRKPFGAPFGVPFLGGVTGGGGIPQFPTLGNLGYYSAEDITTLAFSSENNVNYVGDTSGSDNHLTQVTASSNPVFIEHDTVTQFTLANQPTLVNTGVDILEQTSASNRPYLVSGDDVTLKQSYTQNSPTLQDDGDKYLSFGGADLLGALPLVDGDFGYEFDLSFPFTSQSSLLQHPNDDVYSNLRVSQLGNREVSIISEQLNTYILTGAADTLDPNERVILKIEKNGNFVHAEINGITASVGAVDVGTDTFKFREVGDDVNIYRFKILSDDVIVHDFNPSITSTVKNVDFDDAITGDLVSCLISTLTPSTGVPAVRFNSVQDSLVADFTEPGDFTVKIDYRNSHNIDSTVGDIFSDSAFNRWLDTAINGNIRAVFDDASTETFSNVYLQTNGQLVIRSQGDDVTVYDGVNTQTQTFAGKRIVSEFGYLSFATMDVEKFSVYSEAVADVTNITETPTKFFDASDSSRLLNGSSQVAQFGDAISEWSVSSDGQLAMRFDDDDTAVTYNYFNSLPTTPTNWGFEIDAKSDSTELSIDIVSALGNIAILRYRTDINLFTVISIEGTEKNFTTNTNISSRNTIRVEKIGNNLEVFQDSTSLGSQDVTGLTYDFNRIGASTSNRFKGDLYSLKMFDLDVSLTTPIFELNPTEEYANTTIGNQVSRWNSTTHKPWINYIESTVSQFLEGLSPQTGNFTYTIKAKLTDQANAGAILSSNIDGSGIYNVDTDSIDFRDGVGGDNIFNSYGVVDTRILQFTFDGTNLYAYENSWLAFTAPIDATGQAFNLTSVGKATLGAPMQWNYIGVWDRVLDESELNYFVYERNVNTNKIQLPPQLPSPPALGIFTSEAQGAVSFDFTTTNDTVVTTDFGDDSPVQETNTPSHTYTDSAPSHVISISDTPLEDITGIDASSSEITTIELDTMPNVITLDVSNTLLDGDALDEIITILAVRSLSYTIYLDVRNAPGEGSYTNTAGYDTIIANGGTILGDPPSSVLPVNSASFDDTGDTYYQLTNQIFVTPRTKFTFTGWLNVDNGVSGGFIFTDAIENQSQRVQLEYNSVNNFIRFKARNQAGVAIGTFQTPNSSVPTTGWIRIGVAHDITTGSLEIRINGTSHTFTTVTGINYSTSVLANQRPSIGDFIVSSLGGRNALGAELSNITISVTNKLSASEMDTILGDGVDDIAPRIENIPSAVKNKLDHGWRCATGDGSAIEDLIGSNALVEVEDGATFSYINAGLKVG